MPLKKFLFLFIVLQLLVCGCIRKFEKFKNQNSNFIVSDFNPLLSIDTSKIFYFDYANAFENGFVIPSVNQSIDGYFRIQFTISNYSGKQQEFYYKLFYRNESYKFDISNSNSIFNEDLSGSNFYGSWENAAEGFRLTKTISNFKKIIIDDKIRIVGNPRDEKKFFCNNVNQRFKRNPRVGNYDFLLVVTTKSDLTKIPVYIKDISKKHCGKYIDPFNYFIRGQGGKLKNTSFVLYNGSLKTAAKPPLNRGLYFDNKNYNKDSLKFVETSYCNSGDNNYKNSVITNYIHFTDNSMIYKNIPIIADVVGENYNKSQYNKNQYYFSGNSSISILPGGSKNPCKQIYFDTLKNTLIIKNPAAYKNNLIKQNIGIRTRHGFTYGKYTVKIKFPEILSKDDIWNGLTNSIWLISSSSEEWNFRNTCYCEGYIPEYFSNKSSNRSYNTGYSEIDFEILKTGKYCSSDIDYNKSHIAPIPYDYESNYGNVIINCTNWDMACHDPKNYKVGCQEIFYNNEIYTAHRWDYWYKAITEKTPALDDEIFGLQYYFFQIEWKPDEIIWRIGPEKNKLRVVGYMNSSITKIPDNVMTLVISQEFHNTKWWPGSPYDQENIPFPKKELIGEIFEITIE